MRLLMILLVLFTADDDIRLSTHPIKAGSIHLTKISTISNGDDGFYNAIHATLADNGNVVVLDFGNNKVNVFNQSGNRLASFGKTGSGPGELSYPSSVFAAYNRIFVTDGLTLHIYEMDGRHVADKNMLLAGHQALITTRGNELIVHQLQSGDAKYLYGKIDRDGNFTDLVENKNYVDQANDDRFYSNLIDYLFTDDGIYTKDQKTYKFFYHDLNFKLKTTYTRNFERVARKENEFGNVVIGQGNMSKAEHAKKVTAANAALRKRLGKYHDDIMTFSGYDQNRLYLQVRSQQEQTVKIDVIENKQFIDQLTLPYQGKYTYAFVKNGILLQVDKNDEIGPFVNVFKIEE